MLITLENGDINPGDALTLSSRFRGRAIKAIGPCRIIGYATTHFPYVKGEEDYEEDILGGGAQRISTNHVMCYLNVGWYEPADSSFGQGEDLPMPETAKNMRERLNTTIVSPGNANLILREKKMKEDANKRNLNNSIPANSAIGKTKIGAQHETVFSESSK